MSATKEPPLQGTHSFKPGCPNCDKGGLPIFPVRYAVLPTTVSPQTKKSQYPLPAGMGKRLNAVPLKNADYALRRLRQGFIYLFYEKYKGTSKQWEVYSVDKQGHMWKQPSAEAATLLVEPACFNWQDIIPASMISIQDPKNAGIVWVAFSEYKWSAETLKKYEDNTDDVRTKRMQPIDPVKWIDSRKLDHGDAVIADKENIKMVYEYKSGAREELITIKQKMEKEESNPTGAFQENQLRRVHTLYPFQPGLDKYSNLTDALIERLKLIGSKDAPDVPSGKPYPPMMLGLQDDVGIVHELNNFRNAPGGFLAEYSDIFSMKIGAYAAINQTKTAM